MIFFIVVMGIWENLEGIDVGDKKVLDEMLMM